MQKSQNSGIDSLPNAPKIKLGYGDNDSLLVHYFGDKPAPQNTYFCVRNKHFRAWREKHHAGGDLLIFSDDLRAAPVILSPALPSKLGLLPTLTPRQICQVYKALIPR